MRLIVKEKHRLPVLLRHPYYTGCARKVLVNVRNAHEDKIVSEVKPGSKISRGSSFFSAFTF